VLRSFSEMLITLINYLGKLIYYLVLAHAWLPSVEQKPAYNYIMR